MNAESFDIQPYSLKQLSVFYKCSRKTLRKWINRFQEEIGPRDGYLYNTRQVQLIVERLGRP